MRRIKGNKRREKDAEEEERGGEDVKEDEGDKR